MAGVVCGHFRECRAQAASDGGLQGNWDTSQHTGTYVCMYSLHVCVCVRTYVHVCGLSVNDFLYRVRTCPFSSCEG